MMSQHSSQKRKETRSGGLIAGPIVAEIKALGQEIASTPTQIVAPRENTIPAGHGQGQHRLAARRHGPL